MIQQKHGCRGVEIRKCCACPRASYLKKVTCPDKILLVLFFLYIRYLQAQLLVDECQDGLYLKVLPLDQRSLYTIEIIELVLWSIVWLRKTSDIVLIKLMQVPLHKWSLPKWRPLICVVSEWQGVLRYNISCVEKILISIKFILINFGFVHKKWNQSCV
jgi:hypothetical protein